MNSLRDRLTARTWEQDWPAPGDAVVLPEGPWQATLGLTPWDQGDAKHKHLAERQFGQVVALLQGRPHDPLPQAIVHRHLDALDAWNAAVTWQATWPPTPEGLGRAIASSHGKHAQNADVMLGLALLLHAYPERAWHALQAMPAWARKDLPAAWFEPATPSVPAPEVPVPEPAPAAIVEPTPAVKPTLPSVPVESAPEPVVASSAGVARPERPVREAPPEAAWLSDLLDQIGHTATAQNQPVLRQRLTHEIKQRRQSAPTDWFESAFFPALAAQSSTNLNLLLRLAPELQFSIVNPVEWLRSKDFWEPLRASGENQALLMERALPRLVSTTDWTDTQRVTMLRSLLAYAKTDPDVFEQRMGLWLAWGGRLDMKGTLPRDPQPEVQGFGSAARVTTVLEWLAQQPVPIWQTWAQARLPATSGLFSAPPVPPAPPRRPRGP